MAKVKGFCPSVDFELIKREITWVDLNQMKLLKV